MMMSAYSRPLLPLLLAVLATAVVLTVARPVLADEAAQPASAEEVSPDAMPAEVRDTDTTETKKTLASTLKHQSVHVPDPLHVGKPVKLVFQVEHPAHTKVSAPASFPGSRWELLDVNYDITPRERWHTTSVELVFALYRTGPSTMPSFDLTVTGPGDSVTTLATDPVNITVSSLLAAGEDASFKEPRPPVAIWVEDHTLAWVGGIGLSALIAALLAFLAVRRRRLAEQMAPIRPAHEVALEKLDALAASGLLERGETMMYYVRLSGAVREYLGRRYDFPGTELTTSEIIEELRDISWPRAWSKGEVAAWLEHCDVVKFSGFLPPRARAQQHLKQAIALVQATRRQFEPVEPAETREAP